MTTYIGQPADQYRFAPPPPPLPKARIFPSHSFPAVLPPKGLTLIANSPIIPPKEIAYSDDNDSLQRDCPNQECEGH